MALLYELAAFRHNLFIHQLHVNRWPIFGWFVNAGGMVASYMGCDHRQHRALFCDVCGKKFDEDKPELLGTLADSLLEEHMLDNLCRRMMAHRHGFSWPPRLEPNSIKTMHYEADVIFCKLHNGAKMDKA